MWGCGAPVQQTLDFLCFLELMLSEMIR